jgi:hypothetical protein
VSAYDLDDHPTAPTRVEVHYVRGNIHQVIRFSSWLRPAGTEHHILTTCRKGDMYRFSINDSTMVLVPVGTVLSIIIRDIRSPVDNAHGSS